MTHRGLTALGVADLSDVHDRTIESFGLVDVTGIGQYICVAAPKVYIERQRTRDEVVHWIQPRLIDCEGFDCFDEEAGR